MELLRGRTSDNPSVRRTGPFTGEAWGDPLFDSPTVAMSTVYFTPGARTFWHRHDGGQVLQIVAGTGMVATRERVVQVQAGDLIWTPPGEEHWHGATRGGFLVHTTTTIGSTAWLDEVDQTTYEAINFGTS